MPKKTNSSNHYISNQKRDKRREEHEQRVASWQALSPEQQWAKLDEFHGVAQGASRQRARLARILG